MADGDGVLEGSVPGVAFADCVKVNGDAEGRADLVLTEPVEEK